MTETQVLAYAAWSALCCLIGWAWGYLCGKVAALQAARGET